MGAKVTFKKRVKEGFYACLSKRVDQYFLRRHKSKHATAFMMLKTVVLLAIYLTLIVAIYSNGFVGIGLVGLFALLGITKSLIGFNVVHDALHDSYSASHKVNRVIGYLFDLNGTSSYIWKISHNLVHHTYTNIPGIDEDIEKGAILRLSPKDPVLWFHRFQYIYAFILYGFTTINWVLFSDYLWFYREAKEKNVSIEEQGLFYFFKAVNLIAFLFLPLMVLSAPWWIIVLGFIAMHFAAGVILSVVFQLAHLVQGVEFPEPNQEGQIEEEWAVHELRTTSNFGTDSLLLTHLVGGLNFQVEHHLFPRICHTHYPEIAKIVKKTAHEFGIPYNEQPTFLHALRSHIIVLKSFGKGIPVDEGCKI